jgi:hypothetical protein
MKPWEKYSQKVAANEAAKPWEKYKEANTQTTPAQESPKEEASSIKNILGKGLDYTLRGLDYAGGVVRTGLADTLLPADQITKADWDKALKGKALQSAEILDRAGVPEMGKLSDIAPGLYSESGDGFALQQGGWADPSTRGALGLALDIGTDPLTYATLGASSAGKAKKLLVAPASEAMEQAGKAIYKSGLKRIDQEAIKYGKEPVSDVLMKYGISGSAGSIQNQMDDLAGKLYKQQQGILQAADEAGQVVPMQDAMKAAENYVAGIRASRDPVKQAAADKLLSSIADYKKLDVMPNGRFGPAQPIGVMQANEFKTSIYDSLPKGAWAEAASGLEPSLIAGKKQQARGLKESVEAAASNIGKGDELKQLNDELGRLLTTKDKALSEANKEANKNLFTSVDGIIAGANNPTMLAVKKAADFAKMTGPRTSTGKFLYNQGKGELSGPIWDILLRQAAIEANQGEQDQ